MIRELVNGLLEELTPDAIALTDAWGFTDASLRSVCGFLFDISHFPRISRELSSIDKGKADLIFSQAIGCRDGKVYERIMMWTRQLPVNVHAKENGGVFSVRAKL